MKKVLCGLTGVPAGGKSAVATILKNNGFNVLDADSIAKEVVYTQHNRTLLMSIFGADIFTESDDFDFRKIGDLFFADTSGGEKKRENFGVVFNEIILNKVLWHVHASKNLIIFVENALIFEQNWNFFDLVICAYCSKEEAIRRLKKYRNWSDERIRVTFKIQMDPETKRDLSDFVINTEITPVEMLEEKTKELLKEVQLLAEH